MFTKIRAAFFTKYFLLVSIFLVTVFLGLRVEQYKNIAIAAPNSPRVYVPVSEGFIGGAKVSVIDTGNNSIITNIPVGSGPFDAKISPDGTRVYVANHDDSTVSVIDTGTNTVTTTISLGSGKPVSMSLNITGTRLYIGSEDTNEVKTIDTSTNTVINTIAFGNIPRSVAAKPGSVFVYVALDGGDLAVIDTTTNTIINSMSLGVTGQGMVFNVNGTRLYMTEDTGVFLVMDAMTNMVLSKIQISPNTGNPVLSNDQSFLYSTGATCSISVVDTNSNQWAESMPGVVQGGCGGIVEHPTLQRFYVGNIGAFTISVVNKSGSPVAIIPVGGTPGGMAVKP